MAGSRISVEITGVSGELQAAVAKAADSLKGLGSVLAKQTDLSVAAGDRTIRVNELVSKSYQGMAREAGLASEKTIAAFERQGAVALTSAREQQRAAEQTAAAAKASAAEQVRASEQSSLASRRSADTHVASAKRAEQAFGSQSSALTKAGKTITTGLLGAAAASVYLAVKFESSTLRLQTQAGATAGQMQKLRRGILDMAAAVGFTPNQLADGMYHVVSSMNAVLPPTQRVVGELKVLRTAAELAQVGHSNLEETTYALASAMNALHAPIRDTSKVAGELNAIVGSGDMTMTDLIEALKSGLLPAARTAGISLQSVGAAMAVMGDQGMRGSLAGTRLRMSIALLSAPSEAAAKILQTLGMSSQEATSRSEAMAAALQKAGLRTTTLSADLRRPDGIAYALADLNQHLRESGLIATGAAAVMNKAFGGGRMGATITLLADSVGRVDTKFQQIGRTSSQFGSDFQKTTHTAAFELHAFEAGVISLATRLGTDLLPAVGTVVHDLSDVVGWFERGSTAAHVLELGIGTLATVAIGSYLVSRLTAAIKLMREFGQVIQNPLGSMQRMGAATRPGAAGAGGIAGQLGGGMIGGVRTGGMLPGSRTNPIVVVVEAGDIAGLGSQSASGLGTTESRAAQAEKTAMQGAGVPVAAAATAEAGAVEATAATGLMASIKSGLSTALGGVMKGGLIAGGGMLASQAVGGLIGGKTGKDVSTVGTAASIGAGIGSFLGPEGTLAGGILGGIVGGFKTFLGTDATALGDQIASKVTAPMGPAIEKQFGQHLAAAAQKASDQTQLANMQAPGGLLSRPTRGNISALGITDALKGKTPGAEASAALTQEGAIAGSAFVAGLKGVKFPTTGTILADFHETLAKLPAQAQPEAAKTMLAWAHGLEANKQLPKGAVNSMIKSLEAEIPGLTTYLEQHGRESDAAFAKALKFEQATSTLKTTLEGYRQSFGDFAISTNLTGQNIDRNIDTAMDRLHQDMTSKVSATRIAATAEFRTLQSETNQTFSAMVAQVQTQQSNLTSAIRSGSSQAAQIAGQNFAGLETNVYQAMDSGVLSTARGVAAIQKDLNAALKAFGGKQIPLAALVASEGPNPGGAFAGAGHSGHFAGGGVVGGWGQKGQDSVVAVLGKGEAVLKHQDQALVNAGLGVAAGHGFPISSLGGVFQATAGQKHWMASGGFAGMPAGGTLSYSQLEGLWLAGGGPASVESIAAAIALAESGGRDVVQQGQPYATTGVGPWQITPGGSLDLLTNAREAVAKYKAAGNSFAPWTTFNDGAYRQFLRGGIPAIGGAASNITAPRVGGAGAVSAMVQAGLDMAAAAANAYLQAQAPTGGGGGAGSGTALPGKLGSGVHGAYAAVLPAGRTDQGVDFAGSGPIGAVLDGRVVEVGLWPGWPGTGGLVYSTSRGNVYAMEHVQPLVKVGQQLRQGQVIANVLPGYPWLETGWANSSATGPLTPYNGAADGTAMPAGQSFRSFIGYDEGGFTVDYTKRGGPGFTHKTGAGTLRGTKVIKGPKPHNPKVKQPKPHKPGKLGKLPVLKALPGFDQTLLNQISGLDTTIGELINWQGYITQLHSSGAPLAALVTLADGSQVVNWDGMIDPSTGQFAKGINARLAEIDGGNAATAAGMVGTLDKSTELGIDNLLLADYISEQGLAGQAQTALGTWLTNMNADLEKWTDQYAADTGSAGWLTHEKELLPLQKQVKESKLTERFDRLRHRIQVAGLKARFSGSALLQEILSGLKSEEETELQGLPGAPPPEYAVGPRGGQHLTLAYKLAKAAWEKQRKSQSADIRDTYSDRVAAVRQAALKSNFARQLGQSNALYGLGVNEQADRAALALRFGKEKVSLTDRLRDATADRAYDKKFVTSDTSALALAPGFAQTLGAYLDPMGTLQINIDTEKNIDIPGLLSEMSDLTGTTVPPSTSSTGQNTQLASLYQQLALQASQSYAISQAQLGALASMIPEIPRYKEGGPVLNDTLAMVHRGEHVVPEGGALVMRGGGSPDVHVHSHVNVTGDAAPLIKMIDQRVRHPDNVRAVSTQIGRRTSMLQGAPGSFRR